MIKCEKCGRPKRVVDDYWCECPLCDTPEPEPEPQTWTMYCKGCGKYIAMEIPHDSTPIAMPFKLIYQVGLLCDQCAKEYNGVEPRSTLEGAP